jgi:hypothetical protein
MSRWLKIRIKLLTILLSSRFDTFEILLSSSAIAHGLTLFSFGWSALPYAKYEMATAIWMSIFGIYSMYGSSMANVQVRRLANLMLFAGWCFMFTLAIVNGYAIPSIAYLTIMLISAFIYLNVSVGVVVNGDR